MNDKSAYCTINNDGTVSVDTIIKGVRTTKMVSLENFSQALASDREKLELPLFPTGIKKYRSQGDNLLIAIEYPETVISNFRYKSDILSIPVPKCVWLTLLRNIPGKVDAYKIIKTWPFALDMPLLSESQTLYKWPFTNWSLSFNNICWGNHESINVLRQECKISNVSSQYSMYFNAIANDHLGWDFISPEDSDSIKPYCIQDRPHFDPSWLISEGTTFSSMCDKMMGVA